MEKKTSSYRTHATLACRLYVVTNGRDARSRWTIAVHSKLRRATATSRHGWVTLRHARPNRASTCVTKTGRTPTARPICRLPIHDPSYPDHLYNATRSNRLAEELRSVYSQQVLLGETETILVIPGRTARIIYGACCDLSPPSCKHSYSELRSTRSYLREEC